MACTVAVSNIFFIVKGGIIDLMFDEYLFVHKDINECSISNGGCSKFCNNIYGSYYCSCNDSEYLDPDNHTCVGKNNFISIDITYDITIEMT